MTMPVADWERSDRFDMALDLTTGREGLDALAKAMQRWIAHVIAVDVSVQPLKELRRRPYHLVCRAQMPTPPRLATCSGAVRILMMRTLARVVGLFRLDRRSLGHGR